MAATESQLGATSPLRDPQVALQELTLHGHRVTYRSGGEGPLIVLLHGITGSSGTWIDVLPTLARRYTVIAPDLLGHGGSAKPRGDYSLGAYASGVRDLLAALGHERATIVGHSLGGGVAMQFAYQFPEWVERLVLVSSGGLGREVHGALRAASLPGAEYVIPLLCGRWIRNVGDGVSRGLTRLGLRAGPDMEEMWRGFRSLGSLDNRQAFLHTVRSIIDVGGQRVSAHDRLYLAQHVPTLLVWGENDPIIPVEHARESHELIPDSQLVTFRGAGHFPHRDRPRAFAAALDEFCSTTEPADLDHSDWKELLRPESSEELAEEA
jgi:pimeloyl-ACP methyl ester carboxylesterase